MRSRPIGLVLLAVAGAACDSGSVTTPPTPTAPPTATPAGPTRTVHVTTSFGPLTGGAGLRNDVDNLPAGKVDAVLEWKSESGNLNLYVTQASCPGIPEVLSGQCARLTEATSTGKPEKLTFDNPTTRTWTFWIHNVGSGAESGTLEVGVTRQPSAGRP